jgi:hypothetical protein
MNKEDIIRMAREADIDWHRHWNDDESNRLERFAALVAAAAQKDAARYQHIKGMARAMSLDISGNHYWHMGLRDIRGPNLDEAIDRAIEAKFKEKNT